MEFIYILGFFLLSLPFIVGIAFHYAVSHRYKSLLASLEMADYHAIEGVVVTRYPVNPPPRSYLYYNLSGNIIVSDTKIWVFLYLSFLGIKWYYTCLFFDFAILPNSRKPKANKTKMRLIYDGERPFERDVYCQLDFYKKNINVENLLTDYNIPYETGYQQY